MTSVLNQLGEECYVPLPKIDAITAYGSYIFVEILSTQEVLGTKLKLSGDTQLAIHEAYVLSLGPQVPEGYGVEVGHRVFIDGPINFSPNYSDYKFTSEGRKRGMVMYSSIKGHCQEED
jgi:hypothetical protein